MVPSADADLGACSDPVHAMILMHSQDLLQIAIRLMDSRDMAEDAVQETLMHAIMYWPSMSKAANQRAYLRRMLVNNIIRKWNSRKLDLDSSVDIETTIASEPDAVEQSLHDERLSMVETALATINTDYRRALKLRYEDDLSFVEIAAVMNVPPATVRTWVRRGLARLRKKLVEEPK